MPDSLTFEEYALWEQGISGATMAGGSYVIQSTAILPAICRIVTNWELKNLPSHPTPETFPATPVGAVSDLLVWLVECIAAIVKLEDDSPNA